MSFSKLDWLKRTHGQKFTPSELRVLLAIYCHTDGQGRKAYPGGDLIAQEACVARTTVSEAITSLRTKGWIREVSRGNGVDRKNSVYDLVRDAPKPPQDSAETEPHSSAYEDMRGSAKPDTNQVLVSDPLTDPGELRPLEGAKRQRDLVESATSGRPLSVGEVMMSPQPVAVGEASARTEAEQRSDPWDQFLGSPLDW